MADRLSPRQRECLELHWRERATSKEIAHRLGIAPSTVDGYFADAVQTLGARDRRHAALLAFGIPPELSGGGYTGVAEATDLSSWLPLRTGAHNDLSFATRLVWIFILAVLCAVGFGALADGAHLISSLVR